MTDPFLAAIGLAVIPTLMLFNRSFARRMEGPIGRAQQQISEVSSVVHESIDGALIVKTLGREDAETAKLAAKADVLRRERVEAGFVRASFEPALEALPAIGIILLLAVGSWRVSRGDVTLGTLVQFVSLFYLLAWPMRFIGWILGELPRAVVGKARVDEVLATPITVEPPRRPVLLPDGPLGIEVQALTYRLDGVPVLNGVDLEVRPDESVAIVGPTGAGKSVLTQLLVRLDDPDEGEVLIGGRQRPARGPAGASGGGHAGVPGELPVRHDRSGRTSRWTRAPTTTRFAPPRGSRAPTRSSGTSRTATTPWWASAA